MQLGRIPPKLPDRTSEVCSGDCLPAAYTDSKKGGSFYCYNLLAELDTPGEIYLNRSAGALYIWPLAGSTNQYGRANVTSSRLRHLIRVTGAKGVVFQDLHLRHARMAGVVFQDATDSVLSRGSVSMIGGMGVNISGGWNCTVEGLSVSDTGAGGVFMDGGDRPSLTAAEHTYVRSHPSATAQLSTYLHARLDNVAC